MNRLLRGAALLLACGSIPALLISAASGQAPAPKQNESSAPVKLPSGLDKDLVDPSVNPCTNFVQYACGNFTKLYPTPPDLPGYDNLMMVDDHTRSVLHQLLDNVADKSAQHTPNEQKIGDYYATCMDEKAIDDAGLKPFQPELDRISALSDKKQLTDLLAHDQMINIGAFFNYSEQQDFADARKQIAVVDQGGIGLPERDYYFRTGDAAEKTRKDYVAHIATMLGLLGEPADKASADAEKIMALETALAKVSMAVTDRRDPHKVYHMMPATELAKLTPDIDWPQLFARTGVPGIADLNVTNPDFFKGLQAILDSTDLETIKTYLRWQLVNSTPSYALPKAMYDADFEFYGRELSGEQVERPRWKRCVSATDNALGQAIGQVYVNSQFSAAQKAFTSQMVHDIENAMDSELDKQDWMSPETRAKAKAKLQMVANKVGYPEHWRDYSKLSVTRGDALGNAYRAAVFENNRLLAKIGKPVNRDEWLMSPSTVNAYYDPSMNDINFPAAFLQSPIYDPKATDAENYGHLGFFVGHELTHGFDDQGSQFDGNGNLKDWWTADDRKKFDNMTECVQQEYGNFTAVDHVKVNGKLTLGENTADNGGLRLAYMAFQADAKRKGIDVTAKDDSGYTPDQQFFMAFGQDWCGGWRPQLTRLIVQTDPHSPDPIRANGVVQNLTQFGQAFGCKVGQPMMPDNACHVW
ncbi:MAG TPA: M13 family metallopeptidase [Terracidiphilus sp.]|jgi:endothelin-converting enzyme/putative endopeptidase